MSVERRKPKAMHKHRKASSPLLLRAVLAALPLLAAAAMAVVLAFYLRGGR